MKYKNMEVKFYEVGGLIPALKGMRNPMNSWHLQDSSFKNNEFHIGENDLRLAHNLIKAGSEHCKFLRQIVVWIDITMPRYWWSEFDTYGFNTKNSCSTMHKLLNKKSKITIEDFYIEYEEDEVYFKDIIHNLNRYRKKYLDENVTNKVKYLRKAKAILPESYLQTRTVSTNYQELRNIYFQRKNHRLDKEWGLFIKWIESLPYAKELITL